jgi:hypothetical protein
VKKIKPKQKTNFDIAGGEVAMILYQNFSKLAKVK